jgi:hypothetical protein
MSILLKRLTIFYMNISSSSHRINMWFLKIFFSLISPNLVHLLSLVNILIFDNVSILHYITFNRENYKFSALPFSVLVTLLFCMPFRMYSDIYIFIYITVTYIKVSLNSI